MVWAWGAALGLVVRQPADDWGCCSMCKSAGCMDAQLMHHLSVLRMRMRRGSIM